MDTAEEQVEEVSPSGSPVSLASRMIREKRRRGKRSGNIKLYCYRWTQVLWQTQFHSSHSRHWEFNKRSVSNVIFIWENGFFFFFWQNLVVPSNECILARSHSRETWEKSSPRGDRVLLERELKSSEPSQTSGEPRVMVALTHLVFGGCRPRLHWFQARCQTSGSNRWISKRAGARALIIL